MKKAYLLLFLLANTLTAFSQQVNLNRWFSDVNTFFNKYVEDGYVNYDGISENPMDLVKLIDAIEEVDINGYDENTQKAFWINTYNLLVISEVIINYPITSPRDVMGFFNANKHKAAGQWLTLDDIEKKKLLAATGDVRLHFALVCASKSCPALAMYAYIPEKLDEQLNRQTVSAMNNDYFIRVKPEEKRVQVSEIFKWYKSDFLKEGPNIISFINLYRTEKIPEDYKFEYYNYDWSLNEKKKSYKTLMD